MSLPRSGSSLDDGRSGGGVHRPRSRFDIYWRADEGLVAVWYTGGAIAKSSDQGTIFAFVQARAEDGGRLADMRWRQGGTPTLAMRKVLGQAMPMLRHPSLAFRY